MRKNTRVLEKRGWVYWFFTKIWNKGHLSQCVRNHLSSTGGLFLNKIQLLQCVYSLLTKMLDQQNVGLEFCPYFNLGSRFLCLYLFWSFCHGFLMMSLKGVVFQEHFNAREVCEINIIHVHNKKSGLSFILKI